MQETFSPQESIQLIQSMINKTRSNLSENRFYFLFWGWLIFLAILLQFVLKVFVGYPQHYMVWLLTIPGVVVTILYSKKHDQHAPQTYIGESMGSLWIGIGIGFFVLSFIIASHDNWLNAYPFFILFYGLGTFVSGRILQFKPLVIGGMINFLLSCTAVFASYDYQLLIAAAAILTSYIIPGHLIAKEKNI